MLEVEQAQANAEAQARLSELRSELGLAAPEAEQARPRAGGQARRSREAGREALALTPLLARRAKLRE